MSSRHATRGAVAALLILAAACGGAGEGEPVHVTVPRGATLSDVTDSLAARDIIDVPFAFQIYARVRGVAGSMQAGTYAFKRGLEWDRILDDLEHGRVVTNRLVIPEGWTANRIAASLARLMAVPEDSVADLLLDSAVAARYGVPGPTLEGYLFPATYTMPVNAPLDSAIARAVRQYRRVWTPERQARADSIGLSEREVITLASIIEAEAKKPEEMRRISAVYHNRLRRDYPLQADPTVQYALGEHQQRLLYAHIDSAADSPYNTYRNVGLPPGPIGSPGAAAIDAALDPEDTDAFFFVARPDGSHVFTRTFQQHQVAVREARRLWDAVRAARGDSATPPQSAPPGGDGAGTAGPPAAAQ